MASTAFVIPQTGTGTGWTNPSNLTTDSDSTYAQKSFSISETCNQLVGTNYNFSGIPAGATIDGIEVEVRLDTSFAGFTENQIQLIKDGTLQGSNKSTSASISTSWATMTYGGATDKWGWTAVTLADIQDSGFGLACKWTAPSVNAKIMYVNTYRIKIYYTEASGTTHWGEASLSGSATVSATGSVGDTDTGWLIPYATGTGGSEWANTSSVMYDDTSYTTANIEASTVSLQLSAKSFRQDVSTPMTDIIPADADINGFEIKIIRKAGSSSSIKDYSVYMGENQTQRTNELKDSGYWTTSDETITIGGPTNLLGWTSVTAANMDDDVQIMLYAQNDGASTITAYIDYITLKVYYTDTGNKFGSASLSGSAILASSGTVTGTKFGQASLSGSATMNVTGTLVGGGTCEVDSQVNASTDDARETNAGTMQLTETTMLVGQNNHAGFRFTNITVPQGATITSAYVSVKSATTDSTTTTYSVYIEDVDDATTFTSSSNNISSRTYITGPTNQTSPDGVTGQWFNSCDFSSAMESLVGRTGWESGNAMVIQFDISAGGRTIYTYDYASADAPKIHIEYECAGEAGDIFFLELAPF